jgi:hypothetical protein
MSKGRLLSKGRLCGLAVVGAGAFSCGASADIFNARTSAMGGIGLASSDFRNAALVNPALVAEYGESDDFAINLNFGVLGSDQDELLDNADDLDQLIDELDQRDVTAADVEQFSSLLNDINGAVATVGAGAYVQASIPNKYLSTALFASATVHVGVRADVDFGDINELIQAELQDRSLDKDRLGTSISAQGALLYEYGLAFAKPFTIAGREVTFGVAPKIQDVETISYQATLGNFDSDDFDEDQYTNDDSSFNIDFGAHLPLTETVSVGAALKNAFKQEYDLVVGGAVKVEPQLQTGVAYKNSWLIAGFDLDLNAVEDLSGRGDVQRARAGVELNAFDWFQLRLGYVRDLKNTVDDLMTAGIGLSPFGVVNLDIAALYGENDTYGAALQLGLNF